MIKALVIEDEMLIRENIVDLLTLEGFDVASAQGGAEGIEVALASVPDIIICDVMMRDVDGYSVLKNLRDNPELRTVPFLFLTAKSAKEDMRHGMELGASDYITKPFTNQELLNAIETQLRKRQEIREEARSELDGAKLALVRMVSHELRTPLISLKMIEEIISRRASVLSAEQVQEFLDMVNSGTRRMSHVVEQTILFTRLELGLLTTETVQAQGFEMAVWDLITVATSIARKFASTSADAQIRYDIRNEDLFVFGELGALKHALAEVITNAINFSPPLGEVMINQWVVDDTCWITVLDQGPGMPPEAIQLALRPFEQIARQVQEQQGIGLGLSLAKDILEAHHGTLQIDSVADKGTQITISLPIFDGYEESQ